MKIYDKLCIKEKSDFIFEHQCENCLSKIIADEIIECKLCGNSCCIHCTNNEGYCWDCNKKLFED